MFDVFLERRNIMYTDERISDIMQFCVVKQVNKENQFLRSSFGEAPSVLALLAKGFIKSFWLHWSHTFDY